MKEKGTQLQMFMPAGELRSMPSLEVTRFPDPTRSDAIRHQELWEDKQHDNITKGYKGDRAQPVHVVGGQLYDGHHRIQEAYDKDPATEVAVKYS